MYLTEAADLNEFIYLKLAGFSSSGYKEQFLFGYRRNTLLLQLLNNIFQCL